MSDQESQDQSSTEEVLDWISKNPKLRAGSYVVGNRMAKKVMIELIRAKRADFILLRDKEVFEWWSSIMQKAKNTIEKTKNRHNEYRVKLAAYQRLSPQERRILGIRKPTKPKGYVDEIDE